MAYRKRRAMNKVVLFINHLVCLMGFRDGHEPRIAVVDARQVGPPIHVNKLIRLDFYLSSGHDSKLGTARPIQASSGLNIPGSSRWRSSSL